MCWRLPLMTRAGLEPAIHMPYRTAQEFGLLEEKAMCQQADTRMMPFVMASGT